MITNINGWTILPQEKDGCLLDFIGRHPIEEPPRWHDHLGEICLDEYLKPYGRVRTAVDAGANIGLFTREFSSYFDNVHSFELDAAVRSCLKANTSDLSNVSVHDFGLGAEHKEIGYKCDDRSGYIKIRGEHEANKMGFINTLDSLGLTDVDLIKMDVEGYEEYVLEGAKNTIEQFKPLLVIEINIGRGRNSFEGRKRIYNTLDRYGYVLKDVMHQDFIFDCRDYYNEEG